MHEPRPDPDRVAPALLWGVGFSLAFHAILFSPQLTKWLWSEPTAVAAAAAAELKQAAVGSKAPPDPNAPKPPDAPKAPDASEQASKPPAERPPDGASPEPPPEPTPPPGAVVKTPEPKPAYPDSDEVTIGEDDGDPSSVVIIGRDAYEEHMAQLSQVSQAGFRMSDAGGDGSQGFGRGDSGLGAGGGGSAANATATTVVDANSGTPQAPESTRVASASPSDPALMPSQPEGSNVPRPDSAPIVPAPPEKPQPSATAQPADDAKPPIDSPDDPEGPPAPLAPDVPKEPDPPPPTSPARPTDEIPLPKPPPTPEEKPVPERGPTLPPPPNQPPAANEGGGVASTERPADGARTDAPGERGKAGGSGASPVPGTGGTGALSDLESAPTSVTKVDPRLWKNGRLVAARGIQLKPRTPQFTTLQMVSQLPSCRPPVVTLFFDRTGKCTKTIFNRSSGDPDIDSVIQNSLYFWRASGKQIDAIEPGKTVNVTLELLL